MSVYDELRSTLESNPEGLRSDQLMEEVVWDTLAALANPNRAEIAHQAESTGELARAIFGLAEPGGSIWQPWYAGQLQGIARLLRAQLGRQTALKTAAFLRSRKHARAILKALADQDLKQTDLARVVNLDESHLGRELKELARLGLVETVKEGRERWARITFTGITDLARVEEAGPFATERSQPDHKSPPTDGIPDERGSNERGETENILHMFPLASSRYDFAQFSMFGNVVMI